VAAITPVVVSLVPAVSAAVNEHPAGRVVGPSGTGSGFDSFSAHKSYSG
jgi:hypothetical protein